MSARLSSGPSGRRGRVQRASLAVALFWGFGSLPVTAESAEPASKRAERPEAATRVGGVFRLRQELLDGYLGSRYGSTGNEGFFLARLRIHLEHQRPTVGTVRIEFQDARTLGLPFDNASFQGRNHPYRDRFDLNQFYWEKHVGNRWWRVGRQSLSFADRRVLGPGDWGNTGRYVWDAVQGGFTAGNLENTFLVGRTVLHEPGRWPNRHSSSPTAFLAWSRLPAFAGELAGFYLFREDRSVTAPGGTKDHSHSFGYYLDRTWESWEVRSLLALQRGTRSGAQVRAWGWMGAFARKLQDSRQTRIEFQQVTASGDPDPHDSQQQTFDGLFSGADTVLYGWMNLCFWRNLEEYRISISSHPAAAVELTGELHGFRLQQARDAWYGPGGTIRHDPTGKSGQTLGWEVDLVVRIRGPLGSQLLGGGGWFFPGGFVRQTGPAPRAAWLFLQYSVPFSHRSR